MDGVHDRKQIMSGLEGLTFDDWQHYYSDTEVQVVAKEALAMLKEQEAVVHCKDCRYACACDNGMAVCTHVDSNGSDTHSENWFCGDGKRRET